MKHIVVGILLLVFFVYAPVVDARGGEDKSGKDQQKQEKVENKQTEASSGSGSTQPSPSSTIVNSPSQTTKSSETANTATPAPQAITSSPSPTATTAVTQTPPNQSPGNNAVGGTTIANKDGPKQQGGSLPATPTAVPLHTNAMKAIPQVSTAKATVKRVPEVVLQNLPVKQAVDTAEKVYVSSIIPPLALLTQTNPKNFYTNTTLPVETTNTLLGFAGVLFTSGIGLLKSPTLGALLARIGIVSSGPQIS